MTVRNVAVIVGSLRAGSFNRLMAHALAAAAPAPLKLTIVEIGDLVLFNQDFETGVTPPAYTAFREKVAAMDAVLFVTPEYNRSMPGAMKNAIDVGSRPYGKSVWNGKPAAIVSVGSGATGGFGANHHLRQSVVSLNVPIMPAPEAYIGGAAGLFDEAGNLKSDATKAVITDFMKSFAAWVERFAA
jgi:chromate reductase